MNSKISNNHILPFFSSTLIKKKFNHYYYHYCFKTKHNIPN